MPFLPTTKAELQARALAQPDFIFVSGDAYVDHPSFGAAIMTRLLESKGYSVAVLARPDPSDVETFRCLGKPRLAFLVTSGAIDSMVMNYTANRRLRSDDDYAPGGDPCLCRGPDGSIHPYMQNGAQARARPDRALIAYCGKCREAFKGVTIIAGGLEASLRRLSHYDYVSDTVRKPIILDAKADLVIYGMGERQILEAAKRLSAQPDHPKPSQLLRGIAGTVWRTGKADDVPQGTQFLPPHEEAAADKASFARSFAMQYRATDPGAAV
ncbi:MAG TPA: YgiQ family radical SAM protein, partial [Spirochaetales bacterium]|nr:YgiQ family radical SAM protein [Spirochaetales bacterium]